ncbi:uncharacterized protein LOC142899351 [Nelusetta ayraudi]|uniref:uncharacterized protein LOC142899351 n=1 Tax=Nelusetta ayraudi TaxID=303726 RepID=UPI003F717FDC
MASTGFSLILPIILISLGNAKNFVKLNCNESQVAQCGQDSLLECVLKTSDDVKDLKIQYVTWKRYSGDGSEPQVVLELKDGKPYPRKGYSFAEPYWNDENRNVSLLITKAAVQHVGFYECEVVTDSGFPELSIMISFNVTAKFGEPKIEFKTVKNSKNVEGILECSSTGYPKGQLRWFDKDKEEWTNSATMDSKTMEDGLIQLSSRLPLQSVSILPFTCAVFGAAGHRENESKFNLSDLPNHDGIVAPSAGQDTVPAVQIAAPLVVIGSLIVGLLMAMLIYKVYNKRRYNGLVIVQPDIEEGDHGDLGHVKVVKPND